MAERALGFDRVLADGECALPLKLPESLPVDLLFCEGPAHRARFLRTEIERLVLLSGVQFSESVAFVAVQDGEHAGDRLAHFLAAHTGRGDEMKQSIVLDKSQTLVANRK
jgi:hypothetical protein